jgi:hypothetical protein
MNKLKITANHDESSIGLNGTLHVNGFSGFGKGWFNKCDVTKFCTQVQNICNDMEGTEDLIGYQCKANGGEYLERFALRCYVLSKSKINGIIGVHVTLSEYPYTDCREQEIMKVSGELKVRNHNMEKFFEELNYLVQGKLNEVTLLGGLNHI